MKPASKQHVCC